MPPSPPVICICYQLGVELRDLRTFAATVEAGSMTRAAERLHLVQSAVSQAVGRLEREAGVPLLERGPGGVRPTEAGSALARHATLILSSVARAEEDMVAYRELGAGTVRLGILHTAAPVVLPGLLRRLRETHPGLRLHVEEAMVAQIEERLRTGQLDLAVVFFPVDFGELEVTRVASIPLAVALAPGHRLAGRRRVRLAALAGEPWVSFAPGNAARGWLDEACALAGFRPRVELEVETLAQVKIFVEAGFGVALLPPVAAEAERHAGSLALVGLAPPAPRVELGYAVDPRRPGRALAAVRGLVEEVIGSAAA